MTDIFDKRGKFSGMSALDCAKLAPAERALYDNVARAAAECEATEALCVSLEGQLVERTAEIRTLERKLASFPKPDRISLVRQMIAEGR